ncbi:MAG: hypothetical protein Q4A01_01790 [Coriobacteriales bacterium]|nr:hypothetical protein [Coriobacteriales bacterium]
MLRKQAGRLRYGVLAIVLVLCAFMPVPAGAQEEPGATDVQEPAVVEQVDGGEAQSQPQDVEVTVSAEAEQTDELLVEEQSATSPEQMQAPQTPQAPTATGGDTPAAEKDTDALTTAAQGTVGVVYQPFVQRKGWMDPVENGAVAGTEGMGLRLEALRVTVAGIDAHVVARAHVSRLGWLNEARDGELCGTTDKGLRLEAFELWLEGPDAAYYDIEYRAHVQSIGWQPWVRNGYMAGTSGKSKRVEAVEIRVVRREGARVSCQAHVQRVGWQNEVDGDTIAGTSGRSLRVEALKLRVANGEGIQGGIAYQAHVQRKGWSDVVSDGAVVGTTGSGLRLEALRIWLTGDFGEKYDVWYRTHVQHVGWTAWAHDGQDCGSAGLSLRMEAVQVCLLPKGSSGPSAEGSNAGAACVVATNLTYTTYVQGSGWQQSVSSGKTAGSVGKGRRIEGLQLFLDPASEDGGIEYCSHMQGTGWQAWRSTGDVSGLPGEGKRLEAVRIRLTGTLSRVYDVWYRLHVSKFGWMGWTRNGEIAGTSDLGLRAEAIQVRLVRKGGAAPGSTQRAYTNVRKRAHMVFVGDSRTVCMYEALYGGMYNSLYTTDSQGNIWSAEVGVGYSWMVSQGVPYVESRIGADTSVIVLLGINDGPSTSTWSSYVSYLNNKARDWTARGASVYYSSITPVGLHTGIDSDGTDSNSGNISSWNASMRAGLSKDVTYLDTFHAIIGNYRTADGLHYDTDTSRRLYEYIRDNVV